MWPLLLTALPIDHDTILVYGPVSSGLLTCCRVDGPSMSHLGRCSELEENEYHSARDIMFKLHEKGVALKDVGAHNFLRRRADTGSEMVLVDVDRVVLDATDAEMQQDSDEMAAWRDEIVNA